MFNNILEIKIVQFTMLRTSTLMSPSIKVTQLFKCLAGAINNSIEVGVTNDQVGTHRCVLGQHTLSHCNFLFFP